MKKKSRNIRVHVTRKKITKRICLNKTKEARQFDIDLSRAFISRIVTNKFKGLPLLAQIPAKYRKGYFRIYYIGSTKYAGILDADNSARVFAIHPKSLSELNIQFLVNEACKGRYSRIKLSE